ncbi:MAG: hypothetical protein OXF50_24470 [Caldilineaceae bacterium]|nr:hypothetical protein [Caldilineaceae bacterium]
MITTDKGFAFYLTGPNHGVRIIQLRQPTRRRIHRRIMQALERFSDTEWPGLLVVMRGTTQSAWQGRERL